MPTVFETELGEAAGDIVDPCTGMGVAVTLAPNDAAGWDYAANAPDYPAQPQLLTVNAALTGETVSGRGGTRVARRVYLLRKADLRDIDADATPEKGWTLTDSTGEYQVVAVETVMASTAWKITAERGV